MTTSAARGSRLSPVIPAAIVFAWVIAIVAQATGTARYLHHDALIEGGLPFWRAVLLLVLAWQAMIVAMMLPTTLPLARLFTVASANQPRGAWAIAAFFGGYTVVWTAFGVIGFTGDVALHRFVDRTPWLAQRPWLIAGSVLAMAGAFQYSPLKERCLRVCRLPAAYLLTHYRRGVAAAFALGRGHGIFCLGCCWALMLVTFAAGFANLWWMAALTGLMVYEKVGRYGATVVPFAGAALIAVGVFVIVRGSAIF